jgi:hypothetical protein
MMEEQTRTVVIIPVDSINLLNPRARSKNSFRELVDSIETVGLQRPAGALNIVSNAPAEASAIVETLIAHPVVRRINFTGSTHVGRIIAQTAAKHLKRCLLELGGKAAFIPRAGSYLYPLESGSRFEVAAGQRGLMQLLTPVRRQGSEVGTAETNGSAEALGIAGARKQFHNAYYATFC